MGHPSSLLVSPLVHQATDLERCWPQCRGGLAQQRPLHHCSGTLYVQNLRIPIWRTLLTLAVLKQVSRTQDEKNDLLPEARVM